MKSVTVYNFDFYDMATKKNHRSPRMARLETIAILRGVAVEATGFEVDVSRIDNYGFLIGVR